MRGCAEHDRLLPTFANLATVAPLGPSMHNGVVANVTTVASAPVSPIFPSQATAGKHTATEGIAQEEKDVTAPEWETRR